MNTDQLKYFITVADKKSLHKASEELFITHQCLSSAIRKLEKEIGVPLFERTRQGIFLNEDGKEIYQMAQGILQTIAKSKEKVQGSKIAQEETLNIMTSFGMSGQLFNTVLKKFKETCGNVQLRSFNTGSLEALEALNNGKSDIAYIGLPMGYDIERYIQICCTDIFEEKMDILVRAEHPLAAFEKISAKQAFIYPILLYQTNVEETENFMIKRIFTIAPKAKIEMICDDINLYTETVAQSQGIGFVGRSVVKSKVLAKEMARLGLCTIKMNGGFSLRICCLVNKESMLAKPELIQRFCQVFSENMFLKQVVCFWK